MTKKPHTRGWIAAAIVLTVIAAPLIWGSATRWPAHSHAVPASRPAPQILVDPLDGNPISTAVGRRRPIGIVVDNHPEARPQWGLSVASRIYEAITEGGVTRYLAVYGSRDADRVGPVRSARTQFLNYALELDAPLAHVGGNEDALDLIAQLHIADVDQLRDAGAYRRIFRPGVAFEHTVFTSTESLRSLVDQKGWTESILLDPGSWKDDIPAGRRPGSQQVTVDFSDPRFRVSWIYHPASNDYERLLAGAPDIDASTGEALRAKVIAIAVVVRTHGRTQIREDTWTFDDLGTGSAWVVQDGAVIDGNWRKSSRADRLRFFDRTGTEIAFDRGPQWVEIIPPEVTPVFE